MNRNANMGSHGDGSRLVFWRRVLICGVASGALLGGLAHRVAAATLTGVTDRLTPAQTATLSGILDKAGVASAVITSDLRTVEQQAREMLKLARKDLADAKRLYCSAGDKVLDKFKDSASDEANLAEMSAELERQLPEARKLGCLNHIENAQVVAFDMAANSVPQAKHAALISAGKAAVAAGKLVRFLYPPTDLKAFHFEFAKE